MIYKFSVTRWNGSLVDKTEGCSNNRKILHTEQLRKNHSVNIHPSLCFSSWIIMSFTLGASLRADVLWGSFVTHSFLWMRDERTPEDVCGEASTEGETHNDPWRKTKIHSFLWMRDERTPEDVWVLPYKSLLGMCRWMATLQVKFFLWWPTLWVQSPKDFFRRQFLIDRFLLHFPF